MLVLTRRPDEEILVGDHIRITVIAIHGSRVRLGIAAPDGVRIRRRELGVPGLVAPEDGASPPARKRARRRLE